MSAMQSAIRDYKKGTMTAKLRLCDNPHSFYSSALPDPPRPALRIAQNASLIAGRQMIRPQCHRQLKRTLLAIIFAVLLSLMFAPHSGSGRSLLRFAGNAPRTVLHHAQLRRRKATCLADHLHRCAVRSGRKHPVAASEKG
jgi:hypothetical protein